VRRRPEDIIGEWGVRDVTPPSQREREQLERDADLNPLVGKPLRRRYRNFTPEADNYFTALVGPPPYMQRLRQIEQAIDRHLEELGEAYAAHRRDPDGWRAVAEGWNFHEVNDLIARHNRWYPTETRLPMDPKTRDFVRVGGRDYRRDPLDGDWILERFPAGDL
jgi:hypothetical protein